MNNRPPWPPSPSDRQQRDRLFQREANTRRRQRAVSGHLEDRQIVAQLIGNNQEIAEQQVYLNIDVMLGGGKQYLLPQNQGGTRKDGENLLAVLKERGYGFVEDAQAMKNYRGEKLWGLFAPDALAYEMDRQLLQPTQPSLE